MLGRGRGACGGARRAGCGRDGDGDDLRVYGDLRGGAWSVRIGGRRATERRAEPLHLGREPLVSFGRTASGELLLVGQGANVYRVV